MSPTSSWAQLGSSASGTSQACQAKPSLLCSARCLTHASIGPSTDVSFVNIWPMKNKSRLSWPFKDKCFLLSVNKEVTGTRGFLCGDSGECFISPCFKSLLTFKVCTLDNTEDSINMMLKKELGFTPTKWNINKQDAYCTGIPLWPMTNTFKCINGKNHREPWDYPKTYFSPKGNHLQLKRSCIKSGKMWSFKFNQDHIFFFNGSLIYGNSRPLLHFQGWRLNATDSVQLRYKNVVYRQNQQSHSSKTLGCKLQIRRKKSQLKFS